MGTIMNSTDVTRLQPALPESLYLVVRRGDARLEVVDLPESGRITVGRSHSNRVVVPDAKCSRLHCELFSRNGAWHVRDLDSRNGVTVGESRIDGDHVLNLGETIVIGDCSLLFTDDPDGDTRIPSVGATAQKTDDGFEIIERKSGTQYDSGSGLQRMQHQSDDASLLFGLARAMAACATTAELCQTVLDALCRRTEATIGGILLMPEEGKTQSDLETLAKVGPRRPEEFSTFLTQIAIRDRDAILAHDISQHASLASQESLQQLAAESAICAPIRHNQQVLGVIHLYSQNTDRPLTQAHLEFVLAVSDQLADQLHAMRKQVELEVGLDRYRRRVNDLQDQLQVETELVGQSQPLENVRRAVARVAPTDALVLIRGESGVGKELIARAVHFNSRRKEGPFVCVNCAALTESLLESELFGHEKGAFTGAGARRAGKFEQAHGGTLFLDEIGEMSPEIQAKFLRVLEGQPFERVGGGEAVTVDVRVVTATNRDLELAVREKRLRRDLFFRLQVIEIIVPPLREHPEDLPAIAQHFLDRFASQTHRKVRGFSPSALSKLMKHPWPGNVRELRNVVERAVILSDREILLPEDLALTNLHLDDEETTQETSPRGSYDAGMETAVDPLVDLWGSYVQQNLSLDDIDRLYIEAVLTHTQWNKSKASRILQIERTTLDRRLKKYGIQRPDGSPDDDDDSDDN